MSDLRNELRITRSRGVNGKEYEDAIDHGPTHGPPRNTTNPSGERHDERRIDNQFIAAPR
jgi:hypothetical protein